MSSIDAVQNQIFSQINNLLSSSQNQAASNTESTSFADLLESLTTPADTAIDQSQVAGLALATGETEDIHTALIAADKAELALSLTLAVRNKMLDAYKEVINMQI